MGVAEPDVVSSRKEVSPTRCISSNHTGRDALDSQQNRERRGEPFTVSALLYEQEILQDIATVQFRRAQFIDEVVPEM